MNPLEREADRGTAGIKQAAIIRVDTERVALGQQGEHPARRHRGLEREIQRIGPVQGLRAEPGLLGVIECPLRGRQVDQPRILAGQQFFAAVRHQQDHVRAKQRGQRIAAHGDDLFDLDRARQVTRHAGQGGGPPFPRAGGTGFRTHPRGKLADDQRDDQHQRERKQVLGVVDRKRIGRGDEEEIEAAHTQQRRPGPRQPAIAQGDEHHRHQKQHDHVGQVEHAQQP